MWAILPQLLLTLFTFIIAYGTTRISHLFEQAATAGVKLNTILLVMSNMVVIPQLVLLFTMLNIFRYNSSQTRLSLYLVGWSRHYHRRTGFSGHLLRTRYPKNGEPS